MLRIHVSSCEEGAYSYAAAGPHSDSDPLSPQKFALCSKCAYPYEIEAHGCVSPADTIR